ncbi:MAG: NRDE family protein [Proteobacteria bacterium]|nr:NRDE family protein [Pseudomonadota bacterium]
MCLVALAWRPEDSTRLVLVGHRDEFHGRATAPMDWWPAPPLLAGRDLVAGGTWLGVDRRGRFAVITNLRGAPLPPAAPTRGSLIPRYLGGTQPPGAFVAALAAEARRYAGFSLLAGDAHELWYLSNGDPAGPRSLAPGVHALSNGPLGADWPKVRRARERLAARLAAPLADAAELLPLLADRTPAPDAELSDTGIGLEAERRLSPPFIVDARYGTRAATALVLRRDGGEALERSHAADGGIAGERRFTLAPPGA